MSEYGFGAVPNELLDRKDARIAALGEQLSGHKERIAHEIAARDRFHEQRDLSRKLCQEALRQGADLKLGEEFWSDRWLTERHKRKQAEAELKAIITDQEHDIDAERIRRDKTGAEMAAINAIVAHVGTEAWEEAEYLAREEAERSAP